LGTRALFAIGGKVRSEGDGQGGGSKNREVKRL